MRIKLETKKERLHSMYCCMYLYERLYVHPQLHCSLECSHSRMSGNNDETIRERRHSPTNLSGQKMRTHSRPGRKKLRILTVRNYEIHASDCLNFIFYIYIFYIYFIFCFEIQGQEEIFLFFTRLFLSVILFVDFLEV